MADNWENLREIFFTATDLPTSQQSRFLDEACLDNPELRREVDSLLAADRAHSGDLDLAVESEARDFSGEDPG
jgi:hypothetical protein